MAESLSKVKNRLKTVKSTKKITNAMKLVSSVRVRKIGTIFDSVSTYYNGLEHVFDEILYYNVFNKEDPFKSPLLEKNTKSNKTLYVIVTSNGGMCSSYNNQVIKYFENVYKNDDEILVIGEKGAILLGRDSLKGNEEFISLLKKLNLFKTKEFTEYLKKVYLTCLYKEIRIIYSHVVNSLISKVENKVLFPIELKENKNRNYSPIFEPNREEVSAYLLEELISTRIYFYLHDALLAEESARRNAMDNATKNADEIIERLNLEYNKARQNAITQEITEVVSGAKAVK